MKSTNPINTARPLLSIKADDAGNLPDKIEVLQTGMWDAPYHGMFMVTPDDLQEYIQHFNQNVRPSSSTKGLPIDLDHSTGAAAGWMTALTALPNDQGGWSLWADVTWTDLGKEALTGGQYAFFSPEFCPEGYLDPEGEMEPLTNVLIGGGLTNRPLFKDLQPVMANDATGKSSGAKTQFKKMFINKSAKENNAVPTLDEVRIKEAADLTEDDKAVLAANEKELSADERSKFQSVLAANEEDTNNDDDKGEGDDAGTGADDDAAAGGADDEGAEDKNNEEGATVSANDKKQVVISASELDSLKAAAAQGVSANEKLVRKEAEDHINSKVYSASDGFKAPADLKDSLVGLYVSANDDQKKALDGLFDAMKPIKEAGEMGAQGTGANEFGTGSAYQGLKEKAEAIVTASDGKTNFTDAMLAARRENPELAQAYDAEYQAGKPQVASR